MITLRTLTLALYTLVLMACASPTTDNPTRRQQVTESLEQFNQAYRSAQWEHVARYFTPSYAGGYNELRGRLEQQWRRERLLDLRLQLNRVLERDGLLNVQLGWNKSFQDSSGAIRKTSGQSELVLRPIKDSFVILKIDGASFLD